MCRNMIGISSVQQRALTTPLSVPVPTATGVCAFIRARGEAAAPTDGQITRYK